ncbi:MAG: hypothetical protein LLG44_01310 [Chloroflexi bacterium]|nr:hypothetical protein [Chloroflexota bacterium]
MNTLFLVAMILEAVFGLGFTLAPAFMLAPFGVALDATSTTLARLFGSALLSLAVQLWFARKSDHPAYRKGTVYALTTYYLVSGILLLITQLNGQMNTLGWSLVALHVALAVCFGYFIFK